jgi:hypothetical protein
VWQVAGQVSGVRRKGIKITIKSMSQSESKGIGCHWEFLTEHVASRIADRTGYDCFRPGINTLLLLTQPMRRVPSVTCSQSFFLSKTRISAPS